MAAAEIAENKATIQHLVPVLIKAQVAAAGDWVVLDEFKGVIPLTGMAQSILTSGEETLTYGVGRVNGSIGVTETTLVCTACTITRTGKPFFIMTAGGEICEVLTDSDPASATPTFTLRRGCFGTTAAVAGLEHTNYFAIMNILFLGTNLVGPHIFMVLPLPPDPRTGGGAGI